MMRRFVVAVAAAVLSSMDVSAQTLELRTQNRDSWSYVSDETGSHSAFRLNRLYLRGDASLDDKWSFSLRHHLDRRIPADDLLGATDWLFVRFNPDEHWQIILGKWMIEYGGQEYYSDPIDIYFSGEYTSSFNCFLLGGSVGYKFNEGRDMVTANVSQSPYVTFYSDTFLSYNVSWRAEHGFWTPCWSLNFFERPDETFSKHVSLGNKFIFGNAFLDFDLMFRDHVENYSMVSLLHWDFAQRWSAFAKFSSDRNPLDADDCVVPLGTDVRVAGGGIEFYPFKKNHKRMRFHALYFRTFGKAAPEGTIIPDTGSFSLGVTADVHLINKSK